MGGSASFAEEPLLVCVVEFPYTVVSAILLDEMSEDLPGDKAGDLGEKKLVEPL